MDLPTTRADWRLLGRTVRLVLGRPGYAALAVGVAAGATALLSVSQNLQFVVDVVVFGDVSLARRLDVAVDHLPFVATGLSTVESVLILVIAGLTGVTVATLTYHLREHSLSVGAGSGSTAGLVLGTLGAGCAACGPAILGAIAALTGGTGVALVPLAGVVQALPFEGLELSVLSIVLLVLSLHWLARGMRGGRIGGCPVDPGDRGDPDGPDGPDSSSRWGGPGEPSDPDGPGGPDGPDG